jgi:hypothetical protein
MAVYDFFVSRNSPSITTINDYVGHTGRLFYDDVSGSIRISDGVTPGGNPIPLTLATTSSTGAVQPGQGLEVDSLGIMSVKDGVGLTFDVDNNLTVAAATADTLGGIRLGPGVSLNANDQLVIDSEGLDFTFGNFSATTEPGVDSTTSAVLSSINVDEPIVIRSNGTGSISVVGEFNVFRTDGALGDRAPEFQVTDTGRVRLRVLDPENTEGALNIVGNAEGTEQTLANPGCMLHITGQAGNSSRITMDGVDAFAQFGGRRHNGTSASPTGVLEDELIVRFSANPYTSDEGFEPPANGWLGFYAEEDITSTNEGVRAEIHVTAAETDTPVKVLTVAGDGIALDNGKNITLDEGDIVGIHGILFDVTHTDTHTEEGTLCWSSEDGTLNIHHADGVVQQVGQELYAYVKNGSGEEIANGACVRFDGAEGSDGDARLLVAKFEADGTYPTLYGLGIATQTLSDDEEGRVCVWGKVRGMDTTGQGGETWQVGDILYASPTTAGGLTRNKPTAPSNVFPVAAVINVDATEGELFVRPTVEQKQNYGRFSRTTNVTAASTNTAYTVTFDTTDVATSGLSIGTPASRLVTDESGLFVINVQAQCYSRFETGDETFHVWMRKNGVDVPGSMRRTSTTDDLLYNHLAYTFTITLAADDYIEVAYAFTDTGLRFEAAAATSFGPTTSAVVVDMSQVAH